MSDMRLVSLALILLFALTASAQNAKLDALRAEGYEALYNLDYETARARFKKMIELAPDHPAGAECYASSLWVQQLNPRQLSEKYPRNNLFKLQMTDALNRR